MTRTRIRRIGNSLGVIIPKREVERQDLREGDEVEVDVRKAASFMELRGILRGKLGSIDELNDLVNEGEDLA